MRKLPKADGMPVSFIVVVWGEVRASTALEKLEKFPRRCRWLQAELKTVWLGYIQSPMRLGD